MSRKRTSVVESNKDKSSPKWYHGTVVVNFESHQIGTIKSDNKGDIEMSNRDISNCAAPEGLHTGTVTLLKNHYGYIDERMYFHAKDTVSDVPKVGERVEYAIGFDRRKGKEYGYHVISLPVGRSTGVDAASATLPAVEHVPQMESVATESEPAFKEIFVRAAVVQQFAYILDVPTMSTADELRKLLANMLGFESHRIHLFSDTTELVGSGRVDLDAKLTFSFDHETSVPYNPALCSGVDLNSPWLVDRSAMEQELVKLLRGRHMFVMIAAPPASGKTAFLALFQAHAMSLFRQPVNVVYISALDRSIDIGTLFSEKHLKKYAGMKTVFLVDDAQVWYGPNGYSSCSASSTSYLTARESNAFWASLLKDPNMSRYWDKIWFVFSATHATTLGHISVVTLDSLPSVKHDDFLVSDACGLNYLVRIVESLTEMYGTTNNSALQQVLLNGQLLELIVSRCGGSLGALFVSIQVLVEKFRWDTSVDVQQMCAYYQSTECTRQFTRCFGTQFENHTPITGYVGRVLRSCVTNGKSKSCPMFGHEVILWEKVLHNGIVKSFQRPPDYTPAYSFASILAKEFISHLIVD